MSAIYPGAREALWRGDLHMMTDVIRAQVIADTFTYDETDVVIGDVGPLPAVAPIVATVLSVSGGRVTCGDLVFPNVDVPETIGGLVVYQSPSNLLIAHIDRRADVLPISITPNGGDLTFSFPYLVKI